MRLLFVDQIKSTTWRIVSQLSVRLATKHYNIVMIFIDPSTRFSYDRFQKTDSSEETLESSQAFELMANQHGVKIKACHADNGISEPMHRRTRAKRNYKKSPFQDSTRIMRLV